MAAIENGFLTVDFPIRDDDFLSRGGLPENLAISQLSTDKAIAAIENCLLAVDFPIRDCDFPYPW